MIDIALTEKEEGGGVVAHRLDCPVVERHRQELRIIMTMIGCKTLPDMVEWHKCLDGQKLDV